MYVYFNPKSKRVYLVPNHYGRSLKYVKDTLKWAKENGMTTPSDEGINLEVLSGERNARMLCVEFNSETPPTCDYVDLDKHPHMFRSLLY